MKNPDPTPAPTATAQAIPALRNGIFSGTFLLYVFFTFMGLCVLGVVASIAWNAFKNHGLIPPPGKLDTYTCEGAALPFTLHYLHGTDRIQIKSAVGLLEGTVQQNHLDWGSFATDPTMLGFLPPTDIAFEDAKTLQFAGTGYASVRCTIAEEHASHRRAIAQ